MDFIQNKRDTTLPNIIPRVSANSSGQLLENLIDSITEKQENGEYIYFWNNAEIAKVEYLTSDKHLIAHIDKFMTINQVY